MRSKIVFKVFSTLLILGMLFNFAQTASASVPAQESNLDKVETAVLDAISAEGTSDYVIEMAEHADLSAAFAMTDWVERGDYVYQTLKNFATLTQKPVIEILEASAVKYQSFFAGNEIAVFGGNLDSLTTIASLPAVEHIRYPITAYIEPVETRTLASFKEITVERGSTDVFDWGLTDTSVDEFWTTFGVQGAGIVVANIDTGVQWNHHALDQAFKCGTNPSDPACWADPANICGGSACDNNGHGTHTMGTMVGDDDPTLTYQVGMAPDAQWIACKGCESSSCSDTSLNACADWILAPGGSAANRPHVVNNSWGGGGCDNWYQGKVQAWVAAGIFPAFSAGNSTGCSSLGSPGDYQESFGTTAHDVNRNHSYGQGPSCYGHEPYTKPNISAPGVSVCSAVPTNAWSCGYSGTSMASPHSAGAAALLMSCNSSLIGAVYTTFEFLQDNADAPTPPIPTCGVPPDGEGTYEDGYGYLNVYQAGLFACGTIEMGTLQGHVYDNFGSPIGGATVQAVGTTTTHIDGFYTMTIPEGTYNVTASKYGYMSETAEDVVISAGTTTSQDFYLEFIGGWMDGPAACFDWTRYDAEFYPGTGLIYALGGRSDAATVGDIYSYDPETGACVDTGANMPVPISNYTVNLVNNGTADVLCTFGGRAASGTPTMAVQCYNPVTNTATQVATLPAAWTGFTPGAQAVYNDKVYIFGGFNATTSPYETARTDRFDPVTNTFTQLGNLSLARSYLYAAAVDGKIYAFGGTVFDGTNLNAQTRAEVMADPEGTATWSDTAVADLPTPYDEGVAFGFDSDCDIDMVAGKVVMVGGGQWPGETADVWTYDPVSNTYDTSFPDLQNARRNHAGAFVPINTSTLGDGLPGLWVMGGRQGADTPPYQGVEFFPLAYPSISVQPNAFEVTMVVGDSPVDRTLTINNEGADALTFSLVEIDQGYLPPMIKQTSNNQVNQVIGDVELSAVGQVASTFAGIPDTAFPQADIDLILDDGTVENNIGIGGTLEFIFLNRFTPPADAYPFTLEEVQVYFDSTGLGLVGDDIIIVVYENTTGNTDPAVGSNWLYSYPTTIQALDAWNTYTLPVGVPLNGPGDVLIGVIALEIPGTSYWPAAIDQTATQARSWAGWWLASPPPTPPTLPPDASWTLIDAYFPGNWMVRGRGTTGGDVIWLSEDPVSGAIPGESSQDVTLTFNVTGLAAGDYSATLRVMNSLTDPVDIPVTLHVIQHYNSYLPLIMK